MAYRLEFFEETLPMTTNAQKSWHWSKRKKHSDIWNNIVMWHVLKNGKPRTPLTLARLILTRHSSSEPDYDGLVSGFKVVIDALRYNGVLCDDKLRNIGVPEYKWKKAPPKQGAITVRVESAQ